MTTNPSFPVIIDTDPGIDDALALYLALGSPQLDIKAITLTFGNTSLEYARKNLVTIFDVIDKEIEYLKSTPPPNKIDPQQWEREKKILLDRFECSKPIVAKGSDKPIKAERRLGTSFHGLDGIGGLHTTHPDYLPKDWENLKSNRYTLSSRHSVDEILYQLKSAPPFTITIIGLGPLTNIALAYTKDKRTFSRVKQVISLGGAVDVPGNETPCAEFNFFADPDAANILTEATKGFSPSETVQNKIKKLDQNEVVPLHLIVLPIDVSSKVLLQATVFKNYVESLENPLSIFISVFMDFVFKKSLDLFGIHGMEMHDPLTIALAIDILSNKQTYKSELTDLKIENKGYYTRGMAIVDRRPKPQIPPINEEEDPSDIWSSCNANNVEIITSYNSESFFSNFFKIIYNVETETEK